MLKTAVILTGGSSKRFGRDKGLVQLARKPLILHVLDRVRGSVEEVIVAVSSNDQKESYASLLPNEIKIVVDTEEFRSPLVGALTGLTNARGEYSVLLPSDTPFISKEVIKLLFEISRNMDAVIPRWPNGNIEPVQAVYRTSSALKAAKEAVGKRETRLLSMISRLRKVRYISTLVIKEIDPSLVTFFNINTPMDLRRAESMIRKGTLT